RLPRFEAERYVLHRGHRAVAPGDRPPFGDTGHGEAGGGTRTGRISGALSMTPPGYSAGKRACAMRTSCTAGLLMSALAAGSVHSTTSITSLGRYGRSAMPLPSRSNAGLSLQ